MKQEISASSYHIETKVLIYAFGISNKKRQTSGEISHSFCNKCCSITNSM